MRYKSMLDDIDDISIFLKYLYLSRDHSIVYNNGITDLEIRADDDMNITCKNLSFPDIPAHNFNSSMYPYNILAIIDALKDQPAIEYPDRFTNRWEEIKTVCLANCAQNQIGGR